MPERGAVALVGDRLRSSGYLEAAAPATPRAGAAPEVADAVPGGQVLEALLQLFRAGRTQTRSALPADLVGRLLAARLVEVDGDDVRPTCRITPYAGQLVAHDPDGSEELLPESVVGINSSTRSLGSLTPRSRVGRSVDVATGSGVLAVRLAEHSVATVATDLLERATGFARLNAALNGVTIDVRTGDLYAPIADDAGYDLLTANLPFVVSPEMAYRFRDGGRPSDGISEEAIRGARERLTDGGIAVIMCGWLVPVGAGDDDRVLGWLDGVAVSAIVIRNGTMDPESYARHWNASLRSHDPRRFEETVRRWVAAYEGWGVEGVATGAVVIRRDPAPGGWRRTYEMALLPEGDGGAQVLRMLANLDWCTANPGDEAILGERLGLVAPHRLEQTLRYDGSWQPNAARMVLGDTNGVAGRVDPLAMHVLMRLDGRTTLADLVDQTSAETGLEASALRTATMQTGRRLLEAGCISR